MTLYHTYFNQRNNLIGASRVLKNSCAVEGQWSFLGIYGGAVDPTVHCDGTTDSFNGITIGDNPQFYAPMALGPGIPNTWYFGSDRLYRSTDRGTTVALVSQAPLDPIIATAGGPVSAIAIAPQDDLVRVVGTGTNANTGFNGKVFATYTGSTTLLQIAGNGATNGPTNTPNFGVGRIAIDPNNKNVAYVCFTGNGTSAAPIQHVWKTTNLNVLATAGRSIFNR